MAYTNQLPEVKDVREGDAFECKLDFIRNLASPVKSPQRRRPGNLYNIAPPFSTSPLRRIEGTSFGCPKSCSPNSDKMCDGVGTLSTASSDGVESSRRASSISGCDTPLLSHAGEERQDHQSCAVSGCNTPGWSGSACSDIEEDLEQVSQTPEIQEFVSKSKLQQRRERCARVVSALAERSDYKLYGYKSLRAAFEALDRDGDGRLSINELKTVLNEVGLSDKAVVHFFESLKGIHGDSIDYSQFLATYAPATGGGGCHGRMWPRNYRMLRRVPSVEGDRWCMY
eukprot:gnl/MRDRNA2_/MRDRNA2_87955_c0_seq1.p1 gnl/MRDRNA2_/MRDRNA2_87955_c0~~gnl/MRDRNA2_/MRDRNA2_87955_c0_seq1.p1  ORF type:complete len:284 (+),score=34.52 gnl/MRDRNA2_/MRDRNA2_87955_c0_seq1:70-921(+)